jgi:uncharacterized protein YbjQ (UPF0145 family)
VFIVTTPDVPGFQTRTVLGPVLGNSTYEDPRLGPSVTSRQAKRSFALSQLHGDAARYGANAIVAVRFDSPELGSDWATGTAVWVEPVTAAARAQYAAMVAARRVPPAAPPESTLPAYFGPVVN